MNKKESNYNKTNMTRPEPPPAPPFNILERETPRTIRIPFGEFNKEAQERCKKCIHFYSELKYNGKFYKGNFCCHWIDIKVNDRLLPLIKKGEMTFCFFRHKDGKNPFNALRLRKGYKYLNLDGD